MKRISTFFLFVLMLCTFGANQTAKGQCNAAVTNWDYLDYLIPTGIYAGFVTSGMANSQKFAIGPSYFTIATTGVTLLGDTSMHTGSTGAYGIGEDIRYTGAGTITITFKDSAQNVYFTLFDLDNSQTAAFTATSPTGISRNITLGGTGTFLFTGNGGTNPSANPGATNVAVTANTRNLNFSVSGTVRTITITLTGAGDADGLFLSDIRACVWGSFPTNYYNIAQPFTGMPSYGFATSDTNIVHVIDLSTATAGEQIVREAGFRFINSLAYDPYGHDLYYVEDGSATPATNKALKVFDYDAETTSTLVSDVTTLGIPVFNKGVQSAAATFYGGCLYYGVEADAPLTTSPRENIVWRIEFNSSGAIVAVCQVYAQKTHTAGTLSHDWGDITIRDGLMFDFNAVNVVANTRFYHYNLQNDSMVQAYVGNAVNRPRQTAQRWDGISYNVWDSLSVYNNNGTLGAKTRITGTGWRGTCGDASGPFKPKTDFGDAPSTYDPGPGDPATHLRDTALRIGFTYDREWAPAPTIYANGDGADEDGIQTVTVLASVATQTFVITVSVYNNTGSTARLIGWLDYNKNNVFDAGEGVSNTTISSTPADQTITLSWNSINTSTLVNGDLIYLRIRLSTSASLTTSTPTGYFANGEVEDYPVVVDAILPMQLLQFNASRNGSGGVNINWQVTGEKNLANYEVQHSTDGRSWNTLGLVPVTATTAPVNNYALTHRTPATGKNYYRLKINEQQGEANYSETRTVFINGSFSLQLQPNPATKTTNILLTGKNNTTVDIEMSDLAGRVVFNHRVKLTAGVNNILLSPLPAQPGLYVVKVKSENEILGLGKLVVQ
jgi:GEVED domain/Secretion system C-terminal sorting domain